MIFKRKKRYKRKNDLPRAVAFVDYEHWYISLEKLHGLRPNIEAWFDDLREICNIEEVTFFANFSKFNEKEVETKRIRAFTNKIIDTYNPDAYFKKDYSDFIILDNIYQKAFGNNDIDLFIIFTGDGHFSSVTAFLKNFCNKEVGIYAVEGSLNNNLIKSADWTRLVPNDKDFHAAIHNAILTSIKKNEKNPASLTFTRITEIASNEYKLDYQIVRKHLSDLIEKEYISQKQKRFGQSNLRVIEANWKAIEQDSIWIKDAVFLKKNIYTK